VAAWVALLLAGWNAVVLGAYVHDKHKAKWGQRRTRESTLLALAALFGGAGALAGVFAVRHKSQHLKFRLGVPLLALAQVALAVGAVARFGLP
jgi:uncharacterized membrane protein YsdA (DUF1294 family)